MLSPVVLDLASFYNFSCILSFSKYLIRVFHEPGINKTVRSQPERVHRLVGEVR